MATLVFLSALFWPLSIAWAETKWSIELMAGEAFNLPMPLTVKQSGQPDLNFIANYDTGAFGEIYPAHEPYYSWRVGLWDGDQAWEFQHIHTKLYLLNPLAEIQAFSITHGFNYFLINHAWKNPDFIYRVGAGVVVTHPENTVRGFILSAETGGLLNEGYYLSGVGIQAGIEKKIPIWRIFFLTLEGALTAALTQVPVVNGTADVPNIALHIHIGPGLDF